MTEEKPIHTIVLDTGPVIRNHPAVSSLLAQSEEIITVPSIISEIKDAVTRARVETTLLPFLTLRTPKEDSIRFVTEFAKKSGDAAVLSGVDLQIAALAYELECERNEGDWRLRRVPGQKRVNGAPPKKEAAAAPASGESSVPEPSRVEPTAERNTEIADEAVRTAEEVATTNEPNPAETLNADDNTHTIKEHVEAKPGEETSSQQHIDLSTTPVKEKDVDALTQSLVGTTIQTADSAPSPPKDSTQPTAEDKPESDETSDEPSDGGEWITPSNLKKKVATSTTSTTTTAPSRMQVATLTTDHALQNLLLLINLNLLSPSLTRITNIRTTLLRCHACFLLHRVPDLQFCTRCGKPTLTRVTVTTSSSGETKVHLKRKMQWSNRGERYSIPKPVHGSANGRVRGGGKGGWGNELVLAPDEKLYVRHEEEKRREERRKAGKEGFGDVDWLPGLVTGKREGGRVGKMRIGAGRDVNARKR